MPMRLRRRLRLCWPYGLPWGPCHHPSAPVGPPPWLGARPTTDEEKEMLSK